MHVAWAVLVCLMADPRAPGSDWPEWRGPARDGVAPGVRLPRNWLDELLVPAWRIALGEGYAAPVVAGERVYSFARENGHEVLRAHDIATGKVRWEFGYPAPYELRENAREHGAGPKATPLVAGGLVCALGVNEVAHCVNAADGRLRWRIDFPRRYGTGRPDYGACSSPLLHGDLLLIAAADGVTAVRPRSGSVVWRALDDSFYSSLVAGRLADRPQIIAYARYRLSALDPRDGRVLWTHRAPSLYGLNVATPAVVGDRIIVSAPSYGTRAIRVRDEAGRLRAEPVWQTRALRGYLASPVVHDGCVFGLDESGQLVCLNAEDGRRAWAYGNFGDFASLVIAGDQLLVLSDSGDLTALEATGSGYHRLGEQSVADSATWAHLVLAQGRMFVRDRKGLSCFELPRQR
jgi:outer membrane protein assembly factor BamB